VEEVDTEEMAVMGITVAVPTEEEVVVEELLPIITPKLILGAQQLLSVGVLGLLNQALFMSLN
jgi:hypothetical protein